MRLKYKTQGAISMPFLHKNSSVKGIRINLTWVKIKNAIKKIL
jgi:hypothetical protein